MHHNKTTDQTYILQRRITKEEINDLPLIRWEGPTHVIRAPETMQAAIHTLGKETILGFDTETRPAFRKGQSFSPTLLQLATAKEVFLFQLQFLGLPDELRDILNDPSIIKAGVAPGFDLAELNKIEPFSHGGFVDLSSLAKQKGVKNHGLRGLGAVILGGRISKSARTSNWANTNLTRQQIKYAATDAWIGREIYQGLMKLPTG